VTKESSAHELFKQYVLNSKEGDTILTLKELAPVRLLKNDFYTEVTKAYAQSPSVEELRALLGKGRSKKGIFEGDLVIVRPVREAKNNDIVVALLHDEATVKRFVQIKNRSYLKAENPDYKNIYPKEDWMIQGKVVGVIRNLE
jgi:SOS-response transcriptional repressor LexA